MSLAHGPHLGSNIGGDVARHQRIETPGFAFGAYLELGDTCSYGGTCETQAVFAIVRPCYPASHDNRPLDRFGACEDHLAPYVASMTVPTAGWGEVPAVAIYRLRPVNHDALGILSRTLGAAGII